MGKRNIYKYIKGIFAMVMVFMIVGCTTEGTGEVGKGKTGLGKVEDIGDVTAGESVDGNLTVHFIDVGQADATLLEVKDSTGGYTMLIDAGDFKRNEVVPYLKSLGVTDIDVLVGTHPHADHIGQMDKVLTEFNVGEVWMSGDEASSQVFLSVLDEIESRDIVYEEPRAGDVYDIGDLTIEIISPETVEGDLNNGSIAMRVVYGEVDFLFTGDAETQAEKDILTRGHNISAKIMILGHHGSDTSTIPEFLESVSPEVAIYSAGAGNSYGHPSRSVVDRVQGSGVTLYGTDTHGTVIVTTDGSTYKVETNNEGDIVPPVDDNGEEDVIGDKVEDVEEDVAGCVDINKATEESLKEIAHIGDVRVQDLVDKREYKSLDDMTKIDGIGESRVNDIKEQGLACVK